MAQSANTKTIPLAYPIEAGGATISAITIRRAKAKDIRALDQARQEGGSETVQALLMIELLTGLPRETVDELDTDDFTSISEAVADFFGVASEPENGGA